MLKKIILAVAVGTMALASSTARADDSNPAPKDKKATVKELFDKYTKLRDSKKYDEAITVLDAILKVEPNNTYAWSEGAWILNEMNKFDGAVQAAEKSIEANLENSNAWRELGYALMKLKRHADAEKALNTAIEKNKQNWFAYDYLAENYEKVGKFSKASEVRTRKAKEKEKVTTGVN